MTGAIQKIFQDHADAYIQANRHRLTQQHLKVIRAIQTCGTAEAGWIGFTCTDCGKTHYIERCCGNRHCPSCQHGKTQKWLHDRLSEQLPTHYFLITFPMPEELRPFLHAEPAAGYSAMFTAASGALRKLAADPARLGVDLPGFFGVLHTWGRTMNYHPHIHFVVPGGGINRTAGLWRSSRVDFYAPGQALAEVCKGIFYNEMRKQNLLGSIDPAVWRKNWAVNCQAVGQNREGVLKYLAPYVFKTAITDNRILSVTADTVTFSYVKSGSSRPRKMVVPVHTFISRYLMHVLPSGFMRIRHYGFMGSGCSIPHQRLVALVRLAQGFENDPIEYEPPPAEPLRCPKCGGRLVCEVILAPDGRVLKVYKVPIVQRE